MTMFKFIKKFLAGKRFLVLFEKLEEQGYKLFVRDEGQSETESYKKRVRNYRKNLNKVIKIYKNLYE